MMDDVKIALEDVDVDPREEPLAPRKRSRPTWALSLVAALLLGAAGLALGRWLRPAVEPARAQVLRQLTSESGLDTDPVLSPDGKLVAYASDRAGHGNLDIWIQQLAGGEPVRVTSDDADEREPAFSPDGSKIVYRSERDGGGIYIVSALGGEPRRIIDHGRRPRFSPDGKQIAYWVGPELAHVDHIPGSAKIFVIPAAGGVPAPIAQKFGVARWPVWSQDGKRLLFFGILDVADFSDNRFDWWSVALDSGEPIK